MPILNENIVATAAIISAITALLAFWLAYKAYKNTKWTEIAKQKDLDETNKHVEKNDKRIGSMEKDTATIVYVDKGDNSLHSRVTSIEKRMDKGIEEVRATTNKIHELLITMNNK